MMKAAVVEKPGVLTVRDVPEPACGEYDAFCEVLFGAICTGTDTHIYDGVFPWLAPYPFILGHESIGRVLKVGSKVRMFRPGDLVTRIHTTPVGDCNVTWGGFAQRAIARDHWAMKHDGIDAAQWMPHRVNQLLPPDTDPAAATMIVTWRETFSYISRMGVGRGSTVLVVGSGGNAMAFVAHARNLGAANVTVVGSPGRATSARQIGATEYLDYQQPDWQDRLAALCPDGFDFVLDTLGRVGMLDTCLKFVKTGGSLALYGLDDFGKSTINPISARGTFRYFAGGYDESEVHEQVVAHMRAGRLDARHWLNLDHPYPLADINDAFAALRQRTQLKAVIRVHD